MFSQSKTSGSVTSTGAGAVWSSAGGSSLTTDVATSDDTRSSATTTTLPPNNLTKYLDCQQFGFTIPSRGTIRGVVVTVETKSQYGTNDDYLVQLIVGGSLTGTNKANVADVPSTDTTYTYGHSYNTWGASLTPSTVNASNYGVAYRQRNGGTGNQIAYVDYVSMTVYYDCPQLYDINTTGNHLKRLVINYHTDGAGFARIPLTLNGILDRAVTYCETTLATWSVTMKQNDADVLGGQLGTLNDGVVETTWLHLGSGANDLAVSGDVDLEITASDGTADAQGYVCLYYYPT